MIALRLCSALLALGLAIPCAVAAEKVTMQFAWVPGGDRAAYYLAKQAGFFDAEGLDVQLLSGTGSNDAITKIETGVADFGEAGLDAILTAKVANDIPVVAVMPVYTKAPDALVTFEGSGIRSMKDVAGKKIGTSAFTSSNAVWPFILRMNGVNPDSATLIKVYAAALGAMLATGQVDGIIQFVTNAAATAAMLGDAKKKALVIPWSDVGLKGYSASIAVSRKTLAERRDTVVRFVRALKKGEELMRSDPDRAGAAVKALVPEIDLPITNLLVRSTIPLIFNENTKRDGLGVYSPQLIATTWEWVAKEQNVPTSKLDPMSAADLSIGKSP
jgi:NitT/TauT family transport system substrate-binding protein